MAAAEPLPELTPDDPVEVPELELVLPEPDDDVVPLELSVLPELLPELLDDVLASDCAASPITAVAASAVTASPDVTATVVRRARSR